MVSLKPFLDENEEPRIAAFLQSYQRLLAATADCNSGLCAQSAGDLSATLRLLEQSITVKSRPNEIVKAQETAESHLNAWHDRTQDYLRQKASEMKDLMMVMAKTAELVADRDQKHNKNLKGLTDRLKTIAELEDVTRLRSCLIASVEEMSRTVEQMTRDTEKMKQNLEVELSSYRTRLQKTEQAAQADPLTGLANRRHIETELNLRIRRAQPFSLLLVDLNGFKQVNDTYGHLAGDQILRQFAAELRQISHQTDLVGRWGGDEFVVLVNGAMAAAEGARQRIEQWVWGTYPIKLERSAPSVKILVTAAIGIAAWKLDMNAAELLQAADGAMYTNKSRSKSA